MSNWQPINTAPLAANEWSDKPRVLLWVADGGFGTNGKQGTHAFGYCYRSSSGEIRAVASGYMGNWQITHWMPLPEAPEAA